MNASILPSFQYFNALICNILIFGIIFDYDFLQFSINLWPESVTKRSQNRRIRLYFYDVWNLWASGGSAPWTPTRGPTAGPWTPRRFTLRSLRSLRSNFFLAPPLQKTFRGPWHEQYSITTGVASDSRTCDIFAASPFTRYEIPITTLAKSPLG